MKKRFTVSVACCALALSLGLAACGGAPASNEASGGSSEQTTAAEPTPAKKTDAEFVVGAWADSYNQVMTFNSDGTFTIKGESATVSGTYKIDESAHTVVLSEKKDITCEYRIVDDNTFELTMDGDTETLTRTTGEATTAANPTTATSAYPAECVDQYGNPTLYALTELSGPDLVGLLDEQGFEWKDDGFVAKKGVKKGFLNARDYDNDSQWQLEAYKQAAEPGGVAKMSVKFSVLGYVDTEGDLTPRLEDAVAGIANIEVVKQQKINDNATIAVVKDSRGKEYLVTILWTGYPTVEVELYTDESLAAGEGGSIAQTWDSLTI